MTLDSLAKAPGGASRILALDVDGTLVDDRGNLHPGATSLCELESSGYVIGLCSARSPYALRPLRDAMRCISFVSAFQGAHVSFTLESGEDRVVHSRPIDAACAAALRAALIGHRDLWMYGESTWWVSRWSALASREAAIIGSDPTGLWSESVTEPIFKVLLASSDPHEVRLGAQALGQLDVRGRLSHPNYLEIVSSSVPPEKGVSEICVELGLPPKALCAVGDGLNDLEMIKYAAIGVTFADSDAELREVADRVVRPSAAGGLRDIKEMLRVVAGCDR